jgi:hypothetical protein
MSLFADADNKVHEMLVIKKMEDKKKEEAIKKEAEDKKAAEEAHDHKYKAL